MAGMLAGRAIERLGATTLTAAKISSYSGIMRRKPGSIVSLERDILEAAVTLRERGLAEAHGFLLAKTIGDGSDAKRLTAYGTLYKALDRLERAGYLESRWEEPDYAAEAARPRRRFYRITGMGERALADARAADPVAAARRAVPAGSQVT
jgi:DNA-binding PadR family transcriptional regulator